MRIKYSKQSCLATISLLNVFIALKKELISIFLFDNDVIISKKLPNQIGFVLSEHIPVTRSMHSYLMNHIC